MRNRKGAAGACWGWRLLFDGIDDAGDGAFSRLDRAREWIWGRALGGPGAAGPWGGVWGRGREDQDVLHFDLKDGGQHHQMVHGGKGCAPLPFVDGLGGLEAENLLEFFYRDAGGLS